VIDPETGLIIFIVSGIGALATVTAFKAAKELGPKLAAGALLPAPFPYPPLPRFLFTKPELTKDLTRRR